MPQPTTQTRWTADTQLAFLLALRLTGTVMRAAAEIGRKPAVCYKVRGRDADFAAAWDAILAEWKERRLTGDQPPADGRGRAPKPGGRRDGMTPVKRRAFLRGLSETGTVDAACKLAGVSDTTAYRLRESDADFAEAWERALRTSAPALEQIAWERAVQGWEEPVFSGGKQVGTRWRHSPGLLQQLIVKRDKSAALADDPAALRARAEEAARAAGGLFGTPATRAETNAAIMAKLKEIEGRLGRPFPTFPSAGTADDAGDNGDGDAADDGADDGANDGAHDGDGGTG